MIPNQEEKEYEIICTLLDPIDFTDILKEYFYNHMQDNDVVIDQLRIKYEHLSQVSYYFLDKYITKYIQEHYEIRKKDNNEC